MKVKYTLLLLCVLLFGIVWPASAPIALAKGPAGGTSDCVDDT